MEFLEVEGASAGALGGLPRRQPVALTYFVADGLARPAEVADQLAVHELTGAARTFHGELQREIVVPYLAGMETVAGRDSQFEMQSDVDDHPHRTQRLGAQHAEVVVRILEVAQFGHEAFRIEGPAFAVAGHESEQALI